MIQKECLYVKYMHIIVEDIEKVKVLPCETGPGPCLKIKRLSNITIALFLLFSESIESYLSKDVVL